MVDLKIENSTTTKLNDAGLEYEVPAMSLDHTNGTDETYWYFNYASQYIGYYKTIPEIKQAITSFARWTAGKGYTASTTSMDLICKSIQGWGEDTFESVLKNMIVMKKIVGDSFAEIIKDEKGIPINLKPISPERIRVVVNKQGMLKRYDYLKPNGTEVMKPLPRNRVLHLCNDRLGDEIHGLSAIGAVKFVVDAKNEAMEVYRKVLRRQLSLGVMYVDSDDLSKINEMIERYSDAAKNGEVLVLPKDVAEISNTPISVPDFLSWINYLDNFFYQALGVPKIIIGGSSEYTEASSKVGYLTFEQVYMAEQRELEQDLLNQVGINVTLERPVSLKDNVQEDEQKNAGQVGIQDNETQTQVGRTE